MSYEEELIEQYIRLCSLMCKEETDFTAEKVKAHNRAMKAMQDLTKTKRTVLTAYFEGLLQQQQAPFR